MVQYHVINRQAEADRVANPNTVYFEGEWCRVVAQKLVRFPGSTVWHTKRNFDTYTFCGRAVPERAVIATDAGDDRRCANCGRAWARNEGDGLVGLDVCIDNV